MASPGLKVDILSIRSLLLSSLFAALFEFHYFLNEYHSLGNYSYAIGSVILLFYSFFFLKFVIAYTERSGAWFERFSLVFVCIVAVIVLVRTFFIKSITPFHPHPISFFILGGLQNWGYYLLYFIVGLNLLHSLIFIALTFNNKQLKLLNILLIHSLLLMITIVWDNLYKLDFHQFDIFFLLGIGFQTITIIGYLWQYLLKIDTELNNRSNQLLIKRQELEVQKIKIENANRIKDQFLANISHELRTPLTTIIGFSELLKKYLKPAVPEEQLVNLERINRSGKQLQQIINDLLNFAQLEKGEYEIKKKPIKEDEIQNYIQKSAEQLLMEKPIKIEVNVEDLGGFYADENAIKQIIIQLLSNAAKFTKRGKITVSLYRENGRVIISVEDTGIGIRPEDQRLIFERFRQIDNTFIKTYQGTGIGLSIIQRFVNLFNGFLRVESELGKGSTFMVYLPYESTPEMETESYPQFPNLA